jgi:hypothetical protein
MPAGDTAAIPAGDTAAIPAGDTAAIPAEQPVMQSDENEDRGESQKMNVKELAEFIQSFYDKDSGTFPKGPEGVCTMVGKKFGEQAESVARKFVERMAPEQTTENNPELAELARIKSLAGTSETTAIESTEKVNQDADILAIKKLSGIAQGINL